MRAKEGTPKLCFSRGLPLFRAHCRAEHGHFKGTRPTALGVVSSIAAGGKHHGAPEGTEQQSVPTLAAGSTFTMIPLPLRDIQFLSDIFPAFLFMTNPANHEKHKEYKADHNGFHCGSEPSLAG
jgi:hypothetical protein